MGGEKDAGIEIFETAAVNGMVVVAVIVIGEKWNEDCETR